MHSRQPQNKGSQGTRETSLSKTLTARAHPVKTTAHTTVSASSPPLASSKAISNSRKAKPIEENQIKLQSIPRVYKLGERGSGTKLKGPVQDFDRIRQECLSKGKLFEDPEFPPYRIPHHPGEISWKRPDEICKDPHLFVEGVSRFDLKQGVLGNCWFVAATANLTLHKNLIDRIVPSDQSFVKQYAGIFHFRFWRFGKWVDVVVDDRLPTEYNQLLFLHSADKNEFWSALLEKAYAKLHGSYEALIGGCTCDAMEDFTGGLSEEYNLQKEKDPNKMFNIMKKAYERSSLMGCSIEAKQYDRESSTPEGLIRGHAYSVTKVSFVDSKYQLIRIRNPWGNEDEWNGPWSDKSKEWKQISSSEREKIGLTFEQDGEFWISAKDFLHYFSKLEICNLEPGSFDACRDDTAKRMWERSEFEGLWVRGVTAGGCINYLTTFWQNPQYMVNVEEPDDGIGQTECTVIVALMQRKKHSQGERMAAWYNIGFSIYHIEEPEKLSKPIGMNYFRQHLQKESCTYINRREITHRYMLPPGTYCIIPSTFQPNEEGEFILRVFSEKRNNMKEHDKELEMDVSDIGIKGSVEENKELYQLFKDNCGNDSEIDWMELKEILDTRLKKETNGEVFSKDVCRSMVAMMDVNKTGKLDYEEFRHLLLDVTKWMHVFKEYDKDNSRNLDVYELREALCSAGYQLPKRVLNMLVNRYAGRTGKISLDDFMMCAVRLKGMIGTFKEKARDNSNSATFTLDEWIATTVYS